MKETKEQYLSYVIAQLASLDRTQAIASYDTGFGLHITNMYLGPEIHAFDVIGASICKIRTPNIDGDAWFQAWSEAVKLVYDFCHYKKAA